MNKKQYINNRSYRIGYDTGYQNGINDCEKELINVKTQLYDERIINQQLQLDNEKVKDESERIGRELSEQSERIDELEVTVDNVLDVLKGYQAEYDNNSSKMNNIMVKRESMESANKEIDLIINNNINPMAIKDASVKEHVMALIGIKESNNSEIRRGERDFTKLQKENVGINSTINNFKVKNFDKIVSAVNNLTA